MSSVVAEKNKWELTEESFEKLLTWLDSDREQAGGIYEEIRFKLIKLFSYRGCQVAEDLADETINRVIKAIDDLEIRYEGDPRLYFYGVAKNVHKEYLRQQSEIPVLPSIESQFEIERRHACLDHCLQSLTETERELILRYYMEEKQDKIDQRRELAKDMNLAPETLRKRTQRIRKQLKLCIMRCQKGNNS